MAHTAWHYISIRSAVCFCFILHQIKEKASIHQIGSCLMSLSLLSEGHVVGWQAGIGLHGKNVLYTLFVKLDKPAKIVKIDGLPENVVPITRGSKNIECSFSSDLKEYIHRSQVWVLLNLSMTDYTSQGKTRPKNTVDLSNCRSYQSHYTCLSRCATASGTVIVQSFSPHHITCGASGYLRQEFRELELLDEITKLRYKGELPDCVQGNFRNPLIRSDHIRSGKV
jgi:hypothetical protein